MCLGIPGRIEEVHDGVNGVRMGTVSFGGVRKDVCLACVPEAVPGEYVVVHVGFAIARIEESEARQVFELLGRIGELEGLGGPARPHRDPARPGAADAAGRDRAPERRE